MGPSCCKKQWRSCPATPRRRCKSVSWWRPSGSCCPRLWPWCAAAKYRVKARSTGFCPVKRSINDGKIDLNQYLAGNRYPGRGIAVALAPDGRQVFIGYFIMGRSANSRNRVFDPLPERGGICTMAADPAKLEDPSLYHLQSGADLGPHPSGDQRRPDRYLV